MFVWRISNHLALDGSGGLRASGRWHSRGRRIVYCALNPATALLEMLVHAEIDAADLPVSYRLMKIDVPDDLPHQRINVDELPPDWRQDIGLTRRLGDDWLASGATPLLLVPCAVVAETDNMLINPAHPESARIRLIESRDHPLDGRLR